MKKIIEYKEAEEIIKKKLLLLDMPIISFCKKYSLNYRYVLQIRKGENSTVYPLLIKKLLSIFYNLDSYQIIHQYSISDKKN